MSKIKRSYYLPQKLIVAMDRECEKGGYVREAIVAAAVKNFLDASPTERQKMFDCLDAFLTKKRK